MKEVDKLREEIGRLHDEINSLKKQDTTKLQQLRGIVNNWWERSRNDVANACYYAVLQEIDKLLKQPQDERTVSNESKRATGQC